MTFKPNDQLILCYIPCRNSHDAKKVGQHLLHKRLCGCINIIPKMHSEYFWPPEKDTLESADEVILIAKTLDSYYDRLESAVHEIHNYDTPCILAIPVAHVDREYYNWIAKELQIEY